jgi:hypothetical protein
MARTLSPTKALIKWQLTRRKRRGSDEDIFPDDIYAYEYAEQRGLKVPDTNYNSTGSVKELQFYEVRKGKHRCSPHSSLSSGQS